MEKQVIIKEQFPLQQRTYQAQDGTQRVFSSRGFILTDGIDEFYAEMTGDTAIGCPEMDGAVYHNVQCHIKARTFNDKNGVQRYDNQIIITKII